MRCPMGKGLPVCQVHFFVTLQYDSWRGRATGAAAPLAREREPTVRHRNSVQLAH